MTDFARNDITYMNSNDLSQISIKIRRQILEMIYKVGSGHLAGPLSSVDILVSNPNGEMYRLEVKTNVREIQNSKKYGSNLKWMMQAKHENIKDEKLFSAS